MIQVLVVAKLRIRLMQFSPSNSDDSFLDLINNISDPIMIVSSEGFVIAINDAFTKFVNVSRPNLINKKVLDLPFLNDATGIILQEQLKKRLMGLDLAPYHIPLLVDKETKFIEPHGNKIMFQNRQADLVILQDVTERINAQKNLISEKNKNFENLKASEEKFHRLFEESIDAIFIADAETGNIVDCNFAATQLVGRAKNELIGQHQSTLHPKTIIVNGFSKEFNAHNSDCQQILESQVITKSGETRTVAIKASVIDFNGKKLMQGTFRDITEQENITRKLKESEQKFNTLSTSMSDALILVDADLKIVFWNSAATKIFGYSQNEALGQNIHELLAIDIGWEAKQSMVNAVRAFTETGKGKIIGNGSIELEAVRKDLKKVPIEVTLSPMKINGSFHAAALVRDITEKRKSELTLQSYFEELDKQVAERTKELEEVHARLLKSERLAAIGELAGMIGHDLRNPLAGIRNAVFYLQRKGAEVSKERTCEMLKVIDSCVVHSNKIINDLLDYSGEYHLERQRVSLYNLVTDALELAQVPEKITVLNEIPFFEVYLDLDKMKRVITNLVKNAADAMPNGGSITLKATKNNETAKIFVTDTGTGIPENVLPNIFTPLFTTKAQGMGFGLAICKRIIDAHAGTISVETKLGKGTTFTINLPLAAPIEQENLTISHKEKPKLTIQKEISQQA